VFLQKKELTVNATCLPLVRDDMQVLLGSESSELTVSPTDDMSHPPLFVDDAQFTEALTFSETSFYLVQRHSKWIKEILKIFDCLDR